ncbi:MAG TPA: hypothetical protein VFZ66_27595 [Herpetosiphonaceae bacterium]
MPTRKHRTTVQLALRAQDGPSLTVPPLQIQATPDISIQHVTGALRKRACTLLKNHYTSADGGAGRMYAAVHRSGEVVGAVLIGATTSEAQSRSLVGPDVPVRVVKRLYCRDDVPVYESLLLRAAARDTTNQLGVTCAIAAYAEPCARDTRTMIGMVGKVYAVSSFFHVGYSGRRRALLDGDGSVRSPRQGKITLTLKTTPVGWRWVDLPPAPIWLTIVPPQVIVENGALRLTSERWRKREWRRAWAALPPQRRVAAKQWTDHVTWRRLERAGRVALWEPAAHELRAGLRRQSAWWFGADLHRTAAPVLPPRLQAELPLAIDEDETTAGRQFVPVRIRPVMVPSLAP